ncbi:MAG TPA: hypothetical protein VF201_00220 [Nitrolancea sp.]
MDLQYLVAAVVDAFDRLLPVAGGLNGRLVAAQRQSQASSPM